MPFQAASCAQWKKEEAVRYASTRAAKVKFERPQASFAQHKAAGCSLTDVTSTPALYLHHGHLAG
jgi:hypothetical protein